MYIPVNEWLDVRGSVVFIKKMAALIPAGAKIVPQALGTSVLQAWFSRGTDAQEIFQK